MLFWAVVIILDLLILGYETYTIIALIVLSAKLKKSKNHILGLGSDWPDED